jgi:hypothetical protein
MNGNIKEESTTNVVLFLLSLLLMIQPPGSGINIPDHKKAKRVDENIFKSVLESPDQPLFM